MKPTFKNLITYFLILVVIVLNVSALIFEFALYRDRIFQQNGLTLTIIVAVVNVGISAILGFLISKERSKNKVLRLATLLSFSVFFESTLLNAFLETFLKLSRDSDQYFEISQHIVLPWLAALICEIIYVTTRTKSK